MHDVAIPALLLALCTSLTASLDLTGRSPVVARTVAKDRPADSCKELAAAHGRTLSPDVFTCELATGTRRLTSKGSDPTCSPICAQQMDVVALLGSSEKPLSPDEADHSRKLASALLEHFELSDKGSYFGFVDVSRGLQDSRVISSLSGDRAKLMNGIAAWKPQIGGQAVGSKELNGLENNPTLLSMLKDSRGGDAHRTLLVLGRAKPQGKADAPFLKAKTKKPVNMPIFLGNTSNKIVFPQFTSLGNHTGEPASEDSGFNWDVMEALLSTCPAVVLDPSMECGRMRWGSGGGPGYQDDKKK